MTAFIELDAVAVGTASCGCIHCAAAAASRATASAAATAAQRHAHPHGRRPLVRAAATSALVVVGGTVGGTGMSLAAASTASALPAPTHPGWDGHRYWFRSHGEWRWTSHYAIYQQHLTPTGSTTAPAPPKTPPATTPPLKAPLRQGWDGQRYWFQRASDHAWRWTSHYDVYLRYTKGTAQPPTPTPPDPPAPVPTPVPKPVPAPTSPPKATPPGAVESALAYASAQLGKPYVWGGNGPNGYDCSGLVQQSFLRAGIQLPRVAADQFTATRPITASDLRRGDLLFWSTSSRASGIHHVAIYLGDNRYIEAPRPGIDVRISVLSTGYWPTHFGRVLS
ncbi:C40 family peptidase [Streptacidiphilus sp. N1-12]|uniref:C40 family peptidase n=2 Tax=Streptacidiphilus alkalitolerans TaxID=3342712 RepID=A0ABV6VHA7_9ACTN